MNWTKRLLLALSFAIAAVLNALMLAVDRLHLQREHIAGYGFLYGAPWAWILDHGWFPNPHNRSLQALIGYVVILWIPAALYACCIWLLFLGLRIISTRRSR